MAFLSSTLHSLGIFEKISRIKEVLKNRLLDLTKRRDQAREQQRKRPHTIIQGLLLWSLPVSWIRFLWRQPGEFPVTAFLLGAGTGGLLAIGLFQLLVNPMNIYEEQKVVALYCLASLGAIGWGTSPHIRCASLLLVPKMLGKEGRLFVMGYALAAIYSGPAANLRSNINEVIASLGCTVELQINNTRSAWRVSTAPLRAVFKGMVGSKDSLNKEIQNVSTSFEEMDEQVKSDAGYSSEDWDKNRESTEMFGTSRVRPYLSTQMVYELRTRLRCIHVVNKAILSCYRWFDKKHKNCMRRIHLPLFNNMICVPMKFKFLCNIAKVIEIWCYKRIPVEGNFGQTYDSVNQSIHGLSGEFSANINLKEEKQSSMVGLNTTNWEHMGTEVRDYVRQQETYLQWAMGLLHVLLSCTFLLVFHSAFSYMDHYNWDIRFDNIYISTYFCQIDARRKKLGKQSLLPLRKAERKTVIFPFKATIQAWEMRYVIRELLETLPIVLLLLVLCAIDWALYSVFDTIRQHSFVQYSFRSSHKLEIKVEGDSILAKLLRKTIGALNTSSSTDVETNNMPCLPQPISLNARDYFKASLPTLLLVCLCLAQAFGYRLRRVIAAFYFPKREKKRALFFYNEFLKKRSAFTKLRRAAIVRRANQQKAPPHYLVEALYRRCPLLHRFMRQRCVVCQAMETPDSYVCPTPDCKALYCRSCWDDMQRLCPVCTPREELSSSAHSDSNDDAVYGD
ncbi:E3 ubiquitin-protein ligase DCST1 [Mus musculus]|uniref:E3 ubiquitin-protein ligase DCST1 n=1 Tax=Mus musculus TaxID=10090 RepID=DCST1_MOUSE|nr:E3 ubiquitin-protein ligase DCST1 [Mus musculus]Q059Y8.1 RecName: Full=E3 ubiquitin-protein ligase DCST1; AltName: Full=DC-STAMP domain-containing protein 1; AltName: Full=RING-type E3 ubiquitin transferase [Mus musculus]AAI25479.1 DC-STAMP domain containing 1 [Mus musculus]AAI25481.1 DC-STAMP domain containing 1 [Mus musculus]EDL15204.1 mCG145738, isoform CRA_a [Mus musculus]|eukprot:NP_084250.1 E3 ubiquitin-protein ligase DCST1 [Mus musculus]